LDVNEFNLVKKTETSVFKMMLCINKQCHNTTLYKAVSMTQTEMKLEKDKLNLYIRLKENVLKNEILNECSKLKIKFTSKIDEVLGFDTNDYDHSIVKDIIKQKIKMEEKVWLKSIKSDENVSQVKLIFNEKNYENYITKLWVLIGFENTNKNSAA